MQRLLVTPQGVTTSVGGFGIEISPPEAYFLFLRRRRPHKSHPLKPISYFCVVFWPPNLTPNHLITLMHLSYIPIPFLPKGLFSVFLLLSPYFHTPAFQKPTHLPIFGSAPKHNYLASACPLRLKPPYLLFLLPCCALTPAFKMPSPT